jgi:hypothetical protein
MYIRALRLASISPAISAKGRPAYDIPTALKVFKRAGVGKPKKGDELPPKKKRAKRQAT